MKQSHSFSRGLYLWIRDLHCYFGLFISPLILIFAVTAILFNHRLGPKVVSEVKIEKGIAPVEVPTDVEGLEQAKRIIRQVNVSGEIIATRYLPQQKRLAIVVTRPRQRIIINVDLESQKAEIERRHTGIWSALFYLHRTPGPHNIKFRANWFYAKVWALLADATVYLFVFISASGIYIWHVIKAERKIGLILLGAGILSFFLIAFVFAA